HRRLGRGDPVGRRARGGARRTPVGPDPRPGPRRRRDRHAAAGLRRTAPAIAAVRADVVSGRRAPAPRGRTGSRKAPARCKPRARRGDAMTTPRLDQPADGSESVRPVGSLRHRRGFWAVAFAFLAVMALATVPSPLYGLYRARDHFSLFMITVAFAVYAVGVIAALLLGGHLSDLYGRRRFLLPAVSVSIVSAIVFLAWKSLPGLLVGRLLTGIAIGIVASTATAYLAELHARGRPQATARKAQLTASAVNIGGLAVGALAAGVLAQWVAHPLTVPYLVFLAALVLGAIGVAIAPETREAAKPPPPYRPQPLTLPPGERHRYFAAALSTFVAFAGLGLFAGLAGLFLAVTLHHASLALA